MPHSRPRHVIQAVVSRLKFSRVVSLQGARQAGKSFLAREFLARAIPKAEYLTLDQPALRRFAEANPESLILQRRDALPLIIDEAQKVPLLFDTIKYFVDQDPRPGQFVLLGSTEFSREAKVKESLTGRLSRVRIFPFTLAETEGLPLNPASSSARANRRPRLSRKCLLRYLRQGGFPGIFSVREEGRRSELLEDWVSITCERDLLQFTQLNPKPDLAREILQSLAAIDDPDAAHLARRIPAPGRTVDKHLRLLSQLFAVVPLPPFRLGTGKIRYFLCDAGLASHFGSPLRRQLATWLLLEQSSQRAATAGDSARLSYYRGSRGGIIDLVIEDRKRGLTAIKLLDREGVDLRELEILKSFGARCADAGLRKPALVALAPVSEPSRIDSIQILPWEAIA